MSTSFPTQGHHVVYMCPDVIFQILPPYSRIKEKKKENQKNKRKEE